MRIINFPAQGEYPSCSIELPYTPDPADYTIFHTPHGWRHADGIGNVLTGISGEEKILEVSLWGRDGSNIAFAKVEDVEISEASNETVLGVAREDKKAELAAMRYEIEISGTLAGGQKIATDDRSKAMITGAALGALAKLVAESLPPEIQPLVAAVPESVDWKGEDGFAQRPISEILAAGVAVQAHVQPLFTREKMLCDYLDSITVESAGSLEAALEQINETTWETAV